jgi:hypothetical protein
MMEDIATLPLTFWKVLGDIQSKPSAIDHVAAASITPSR